MPQVTVQEAIGMALECQRAGKAAEAEAIYRQILAANPQSHDALHMLGVLSAQAGRHDAAIDLIRQAIAIQPNWPEAHNNLGLVLTTCGRTKEAIVAFGKAVALRPNEPEYHNNLGNVLRARGQMKEAIDAYRQAITLDPNRADAINNIGNALRDVGQFDAAIEVFRRAIALRPNQFELHHNLALALHDKGQLDQAIAEYRAAIAIRPDLAELHEHLGTALRETGNADEAILSYHRAIELKRDFPDAYDNLGNALTDAGRLDDAIAVYRQGMATDPKHAVIHSHLILALLHHPASDGHSIAQELRQWNRAHAEGIAKVPPSAWARIDRNPGRRLRVGYVSSDFWAHPSANYLVPLLEHHDVALVEVICYADVRRPDAMTARMEKLAQWRSTIGMSDEQLARKIREDRIDILVDLKLHTPGNRLLVFARKPAPVQITWLGYPGSTGLSAIDFRLSDALLDPPGMDESVYSERTIRLPDCFWCYEPLDGREVLGNALPALKAGVVTFGCLNRFGKINDGVLDLWARVMREVKGSRLLLQAAAGSARQRVLDRLSSQSIGGGRVEFVPFEPHRAYLEMYHRIDLCLDVFPHNGHTTGLEAMWMGVPTVTLVGRTAVGRAGLSQLKNVGLGELAAKTPEEFVSIATALATDLPRLEQLRSTLRPRMEASPLMDAKRFAGNMEAAYRRAWREWCGKPASG